MSTALEDHGPSGPHPYPPVAKPHLAARVPLTALDEVVHLLDTPSEPWSIEFEVEVEGRIDDDRLRHAVRAALGRHPLARARLLPARQTDHRWSWEVTPEPQLDPLSVVRVTEESELHAVRDELQSISVPLVESPPLRMRLVHAPDRDVLMLNVNHAAFDGFGCLRFLQSVARAYTDVADPPVPVSLTEARDVGAHLAADDLKVRGRRYQVLAEQAQSAISRLARIEAIDGSDEPGYGHVHRALSAADTAALDDSEQPGTVNDLLMASLHLAIERWNRDAGSRAGRIAVFMPVNLRPAAWKDDVVTNFVLLTSVSTAVGQRSTPRAALEAVIAQTKRVKEWGTGAALFEILGGSARLPLWMKQALSPFLWLTGNRLVPTALLTNLAEVGKIPQFGPEVGETTGMWFSAPARMPCGVSLGVLTLAGRLHLSLRYRHPLFSREAASRFADLYVDELRRLAAGGGLSSDG